MAVTGTAVRAQTRGQGRTRRGSAREFTVLIEQDEEGFFVAEVPELRSCYTQAKSMDELVDRVKEVILLRLDAQEAPRPRLRFVGVQRIVV